MKKLLRRGRMLVIIFLILAVILSVLEYFMLMGLLELNRGGV